VGLVRARLATGHANDYDGDAGFAVQMLSGTSSGSTSGRYTGRSTARRPHCLATLAAVNELSPVVAPGAQPQKHSR